MEHFAVACSFYISTRLLCFTDFVLFIVISKLFTSSNKFNWSFLLF